MGAAVASEAASLPKKATSAARGAYSGSSMDDRWENSPRRSDPIVAALV